MADNNKEITAWDVIEAVFAVVFIISGIVAIFSLIWARWFVLRCALTVIAVATILGIAAYYVGEKYSRK